MRDASVLMNDESRRALGYPISRWCWRPAAAWLAVRLAATPIRPQHLTACNFLAVAGAVAVLAARPDLRVLSAGLVLAAWFFDRADGLLARRQCTASPRGAWLDANIDELGDVALHAAMAWAAAGLSGTQWPWMLLIAFLAGKYLLMYGLHTEEAFGGRDGTPGGTDSSAIGVPKAQEGLHPNVRSLSSLRDPDSMLSGPPWHRAAAMWWHLPGNADVRVHLCAAALATGWLTAELAAIAVYYNLRWVVRYVLVPRRLGRKEGTP